MVSLGDARTSIPLLLPVIRALSISTIEPIDINPDATVPKQFSTVISFALIVDELT
jgi:hypothetical protein